MKKSGGDIAQSKGAVPYDRFGIEGSHAVGWAQPGRKPGRGKKRTKEPGVVLFFKGNGPRRRTHFVGLTRKLGLPKKKNAKGMIKKKQLHSI